MGMRAFRIAAVVLGLSAAAVALVAPWQHFTLTPLCIFEPCRPEEPAVVPGHAASGMLVAPLALAAALVAAWWRRDAGAAIAAALLVAGAVVALASPMPIILVFAEEGPPAWGAYASAGLCGLGALALVAPYCARFAASSAFISSK